tara:strand:- start:558 stop:764 length:207 start_codon:yes stop_codon:yes gene_type:complete
MKAFIIPFIIRLPLLEKDSNRLLKEVCRQPYLYQSAGSTTLLIGKLSISTYKNEYLPPLTISSCHVTS